ncbi:hypothetical protein acsn021_33840 [Anaerocolumna cellulosilytica]|uniref:Uncharacterized protein n=1 Tax=Anaerocolumna cellulosilytica TaxID=433286 RepID=A0A6S6R9J2_9FIRM|nr:hypothetical protein [Anaerocolumna cellulosilytica]MBB5196791.1 hypothetical protein [Anaerocolumna cellulosilytica]BCJ95815.1 hypothetical protein acsn021_33840 [Anaerocolumna cellulosilytica]
MIKKNYKHKHFLIASLAIILGGLEIIPFYIPNFIVTILEVAVIVLFCGPYEKIDELVEKNLNRANKITMVLLLITLMIFSLIGNNKIIISANIFSCAACIAVGIRSILLIFYDGYGNMDIGLQ